MRPSSWKLAMAALLFAWLSWSLPATAGSASPYDEVEDALRKSITDLTRQLQAPGNGVDASETASRLLADRTRIHDIRNHRAFEDLWVRWAWKKPEIRVLYVGSGAHLAPLTFLHAGSSLKKATFICTEIDLHSVERMDSFLKFLGGRGLYSGLSVELSPTPGGALFGEWKKLRATPEGKRLGADSSAFIGWITKSASGAGVQPSCEALFRFKSGVTSVEIRLLLGILSPKPGSTDYYREEDLEAADLVITHDWSSSPRGNLAVLLDLLESHAKGDSSRPLAIMMEDLEAYPFPVELDAFNPVARTSFGYGHQEYVRMSDGSKADVEDGETLYRGAVILQPDTGYFSTLSERDRTDFFDLLLFCNHLYGIKNVDLFGGRRISAPALLDLGIGYAYRDIRNGDLSARPRYPAELAEGVLRLATRVPPMPEPIRKAWCRAVAEYILALRNPPGLDTHAFFAQAERDLAGNLFMANPGARTKLDQFLRERPRFEEVLSGQRNSYREAQGILSKGGPLLDAACGEKPAPKGP